KLVGILAVDDKEDLMITCKSGVTIRMKVADISEQGRATQGVKLIRLDEGDEIAAITKIEDHEAENGNGNHIADVLENKDEQALLPTDDDASNDEKPDGQATDSTETSSENSPE